MTIITRKRKEQDEKKTAKPVVLMIQAKPDCEIRTELNVTVNGQKYPMDICSRRPRPSTGQVRYTAWEVKPRLTPKVVAQAIRWLHIANMVYVVVDEPDGKSPQHTARRKLLAHWGVGLLYSTASGKLALQIDPRDHSDVDTTILAHAFDQPGVGDPAMSPPAGSAGVPRATKERSYWWQGTEYVRANPGADAMEVKRFCGFTESPAALIKAAKTRKWLGVRVAEITGSKTRFYPQDPAA